MFLFCVSGLCSVVFDCFLVVSTSAIDCLERLVSDMTYYVSSGTLNPTHSLTRQFFTNISSVASAQHLCVHLAYNVVSFHMDN